MKIWEPQFLNANITYINKKKALEYLQSSAQIAGSSNASELNSDSKDSEDSENSNTPEDNVGDIVCTGYFFKELAENRKSFSC